MRPALEPSWRPNRAPRAPIRPVAAKLRLKKARSYFHPRKGDEYTVAASPARKLVIAFAGGEHKAQTVLGALRGQWINGLVTDETCARTVLATE